MPTFITLGRLPDSPGSIPRAAQLAGLAPSDAARLLTGTFPRILLRAAAEPEALVSAFTAEGFVAWASDLAEVPTDAQRILVRSLAWTEDGFVAQDAQGAEHACPFDAVCLLQRGARVQSTLEVEKTTTRKFALGRAVMSGGLMLTKQVTQTTERATQAKEPFLLIQRGDGGPDLMIYEHRMSYQCLGAQMAQATLANLGLLAARFQSLGPQAPLDDRVGRPGFVAGLPLMAVDPVDLGLHLVSEARRRGC
ncbi:hypothetical protein GETHLI_26530 [Geothrix limicola]|uniref:Uncharacterized protein n=1 Tax=Geothrix limicola TaxID=2927978 RepID=A0ABQ5QIB8_9BACT|nr:hypothetical protein [Geothrix limicola]GLH74151.1 hypothetical protein GETHLI_26530 [Geothrix limicola]